MKHIEWFITDKEIKYDYIVYYTPSPISFNYSSDIRSGTDVKTCIKELLSFDDVYKYFMSCKDWHFKRDKNQDICLSLFYCPYFTEFCERLKNEINSISHSRLKFIRKHLLNYLADPIYYKGIVEKDVGGNSLKSY